MNLRGTENKARLALALFVMALVLTIGLSLALYSQARRDLANQRFEQIRLECALLSSQLPRNSEAMTETLLTDALRGLKLRASAAVYADNGNLLARASTLDRSVEAEALEPGSSPTKPDEATSPSQVVVSTRGAFIVGEAPGPGGSVLVLSQPIESESSPLIFYVFSYQIVALVLGLVLVFLLIRWLLRPYHRMVEAARDSPVRPSTGRSESEFVVDTFQALVEQLHAKERELAKLHALERKRAEKSERFSERLISNIPSGLVTVDSRGVVTSANAQALRIFGLLEPSPEGEQKSIGEGELRPLESDSATFFRAAPRMVAMVSECLASGATFRREEAEVGLSDGRVIHLGLSISPIVDASHNVEGALCLMTDLTEVIELRERMKLQENLANLGEMAAGLAHEFKNSLATIHGYVQLLDAQTGKLVPAEMRRANLDAALNEVTLLARLVTDFLNFARPQKLSVTEVNLQLLLEECADEIRPQLDQLGITFGLEGRFARLEADDSMLRRAFVNLLRNAVEAIEPQSGEKRIEVKGTVDSGRGKRYAHVRICDTGSGISSPDLHSIFIPFFTTKTRGYGIGLAIVQKILVAHGGDVAVERSDNTGTVFHCRLPLPVRTGNMESE